MKLDDDDPASVVEAKIGTSTITPTDAGLVRSFDIQINSYTSPYDQRYEFSEGGLVKPLVLRSGKGFYLKQITSATTPNWRCGALWTESNA